MSLDISTHNEETGRSKDLNWLRNPYGLERWARANYIYARKEEEPDPGLWDVCNCWNYDKSEEVDRALFARVIKHYGETILALKFAYFWFNKNNYVHFIEPYKHLLPTTLEPSVQYSLWGEPHLGIPMRHFTHPAFNLSSIYYPNHHTLEHYQTWYRDLLEFADILLHPASTFYCSN
jgi:hypothetical protein